VSSVHVLAKIVQIALVHEGLREGGDSNGRGEEAMNDYVGVAEGGREEEREEGREGGRERRREGGKEGGRVERGRGRGEILSRMNS